MYSIIVTNLEILPIKKWIKLISWKKFAVIALNLRKKVFIVHIALLEV